MKCKVAFNPDNTTQKMRTIEALTPIDAVRIAYKRYAREHDLKTKDIRITLHNNYCVVSLNTKTINPTHLIFDVYCF